jgi:hypothetical protein
MRRSKASPMPIENPRDFSMFAQHSVELTQHSCAAKRHCLKTSNLSNLINLARTFLTALETRISQLMEFCSRKSWGPASKFQNSSFCHGVSIDHSAFAE